MVRLLQKLKKQLLAGKASADAIEIIDELIETAQKEAETAAEETQSAANDLKAMLNDVASATDNYVQDTLKTEIAQRQKRIEAIRAEVGEGQKLSEEQKASIQTTIEEITVLERKRLAAQGVSDQVLKFAESQLGLNKSLADSLSGKLLISGAQGFQAMAASIGEVLNPMSLFASGLVQMEKATVELFKTFDQQQAQLSQATATTGEYNNMLNQVRAENRAYNVSVEDSAAAIRDLNTEFSSFSTLSKDQQKALTTNVARMEQLGLSTQTAAQQTDILGKSLGMSTDEIIDTNLELVALGGALNRSADIISKDFNAAASELAKYGTDMVDVFKGISAASKATGVEVQSLMSITKQFDTFEGAATSAGKLNAILGGGVINSMDLLNATEEERVRLLIQSVQASGKNFESLNRFEKQAIASAAGISDMAEANKIFGQSLSEYDALQAQGAAASAERARLEQRAQAATTFSEKLTQIGQAFAVSLLPVANGLHFILDTVLSLNDATGGFLIPTLLGLVGIFALLTQVQTINNAVTSASLGIKVMSTAITSGLAAAKVVLAGASTTEAAATQAAFAATMQLAFAFAILSTAGLPVLAAITAIGAAIFGLALAVVAPIIAFTVLVVVLKDLFVTLLDYGIEAMVNAAIGMTLFAAAGAASIVILSYAMVTAVMILMPFATAMQFVAPALMSFGVAMTFAVIPLLALAAGLYVLGVAIEQFAGIGFQTLAVAVASLVAFSIALLNISPLVSMAMQLVAIPLLAFSAGLYAFALAIQQFNDIGVGTLAIAVASLVAFSTALLNISPLVSIALQLVAIPLLAFSAGLYTFALAIQQFNDIGVGTLGIAVASLVAFSIALLNISPLVSAVMVLVGIPLLAFSAGLYTFGLGIQQFSDITAGTLGIAVASLVAFSIALLNISPLVSTAMVLVGIPLLAFSAGLYTFALGIQQFNDIGVGTLAIAVASLVAFSTALLNISPLVSIAMVLVGIPLLAFSAGLYAFALGIQQFNDIGVGTLAVAVASLVAFSIALLNISPLVSIAMVLVGIPLLAFSAGLYAFALAVQQFNDIAMVQIPVMVSALLGIAFAVIPLISLMPFLPIIGLALGVLGLGLMSVGSALQALSEGTGGIETLAVLGDALANIALFGVAAALSIQALGPAIAALSLGMALLPKENLLTFAVAMKSVSQLTPESVTAVDQIVDAAGRYVEIQAEMKSPDQDSFIQAMKEVFSGASAEGGGQDVVLVLNGRELGRAVDAAISKRHNLKIA